MVRLKRTTIQSKFKDKLKQQWLTVYCLLSSSSSLHTIFFFLLSFPPKPPICIVIQLLHNPALAPISLYESRSTKKFETQEHLQPICMREEPEKKKWSSSPYMFFLSGALCISSLSLFSLSFQDIRTRSAQEERKKKWDETPTNVYSEYLFFILFSPFLQKNFFFLGSQDLCLYLFPCGFQSLIFC